MILTSTALQVFLIEAERSSRAGAETGAVKEMGSHVNSQNSVQPVMVSQVLPGTKVLFMLGQISLEILRVDEEHVSLCSALDREKGLPVGSIWQQQQRELVGSFSLQITGLKGKIDIRRSTSAIVTLNTLDVIDARPVSAYFVYKTMLSCDNRVASRSFAPSQLISLGLSPVLVSAMRPGNLLTVTYSNDEPGTALIEIALRDIAAYISLDAIVDLVEVIVELITDAQEMLKPLPGTVAEAKLRAEHMCALKDAQVHSNMHQLPPLYFNLNPNPYR